MVDEINKSELNEPTAEWVANAKKKYGKVFRAVIGGEVYVYRYLKRSEFKELQKTIQPEMTPNGPVISSEQSMELEDKIANLCVLWPEDYAKHDGPAASPAVLAAYISDSSGAQVEEPPREL